MKTGDLTPEALKMLEAFDAPATHGFLQESDHGRLHDFIIQTHRDGSQFEGTDLKRWLHERDRSWSEEDAGRVAREYDNGHRLLRRYDRRSGN
jgi:hypothetical protein